MCEKKKTREGPPPIVTLCGTVARPSTDEDVSVTIDARLEEDALLKTMSQRRVVRFQESWQDLSSTLRKRTAQRRLAITESERSDSEWLYRTASSGDDTCWAASKAP